MTVIVTGCGKSGTHWLAHVLGHFMEASHEPKEIAGDVVVDCRLVGRAQELAAGHRVIQLARDGRNVVRSRYASERMDLKSFEHGCKQWATAVGQCAGLETVRLEDLLQRQGASQSFSLPHWTDWPDEYTSAFWRICGDTMTTLGYGP